VECGNANVIHLTAHVGSTESALFLNDRRTLK